MLKQERETYLNAYNDTVENYDMMLEEGKISPSEGDLLKSEALEELNYYLSGSNESMYNNYEDNYAEFSTAVAENRFGAALLELGEASGYESLEDYLMDLAEATGNTPDDIADLITGEALPNEEFTLYVADLFELDDELTDDFYNAAVESYEDEEEYVGEEEYYDEEDEYYEEPEAYAEEEEYYEEAPEYYGDNMEYSSYLPEDTAEFRVAELEKEMAEFKTQAVLKSALSDRMAYATELISDGKMPPIVGELLFGSFSNEDDQIAAFSQVAATNGVDLEAELYSMDKILNIFDELGEVLEFAQYDDGLSFEKEVILSEEMEAQQQAELNALLRKERNQGL